MKKKTRITRVGPEFDSFVRMMQENLGKTCGKKPSYRQVTDDVSHFIISNDIDKRMLNRAKFLNRGNKRGGMF